MKFTTTRKGEIALYLLSIVPFFLAAEAKIYDGMTGLALGIYVALIFCRCDYFLISPMNTRSSVLADSSLRGLVCCAVPILFFGVAKLIHFLAARPMGMLAANLYAMIGQLPSFLFLSGDFPLRLAIASVAANQLLCYCATVIGYALIVRGVKNRLSTDEVVGGAVVLVALSVGLYRLDVFGFPPFFALLGWIVLASLRSFSTQAGLLIAFCMGTGGAVAALDFAVCGAAVAMYVTACAFRKLPCFFSFASVMVADFLVGALTEAYPYTLLHVAALAIGGLCYVLLPKKARAHLAVYTPEDRAASAKRILAHGRSEVFARLTGVAGVFFEMGKSFSVGGDRPETRLPASEQVAQDVMLRVCARCPSRENCQRALGGDTSALFTAAASAALASGGAVPQDMPPFVMSRCDRVDALVNECNSAAARCRRRAETSRKLDLARRVIAEQMYGVGNIVSAIADDVNEGITMNADEDELIEKLGYRNIVCTEAVTYARDGGLHASLTVRRSDLDKTLLDKTVDEVFGHKMQRDGDPRPVGGDRVSVSFRSKPRYGAIYGEASARKIRFGRQRRQPHRPQTERRQAVRRRMRRYGQRQSRRRAKRVHARDGRTLLRRGLRRRGDSQHDQPHAHAQRERRLRRARSVRVRPQHRACPLRQAGRRSEFCQARGCRRRHRTVRSADRHRRRGAPTPSAACCRRPTASCWSPTASPTRWAQTGSNSSCRAPRRCRLRKCATNCSPLATEHGAKDDSTVVAVRLFAA